LIVRDLRQPVGSLQDEVELPHFFLGAWQTMDVMAADTARALSVLMVPVII